MARRSPLKFVLRSFLFLLAWSAAQLLISHVSAQSAPGTIRGETRDSSGFLRVGNAQVRLHKVEGGNERAAVSAPDGSFLVEQLKPGRYQVSVAKQGFSTSGGATFDLTEG